MIKVHYTYPSFIQWTNVMKLTKEQVKAFLPEFDGKNILNKGVVVLDTDDFSYWTWKQLGKDVPPRGELPLVHGIVGVYSHDGDYYLITLTQEF